MRLAGRFSRHIRGYAKANGIPVLDCPAGERKHELAEEYLTKTKVTRGLFLVLVGRAQAPVWDVSANHHIARKKPMPYVNHYSFHILDPDWGHLTIKISVEFSAAVHKLRKSTVSDTQHRIAVVPGHPFSRVRQQLRSVTL